MRAWLSRSFRFSVRDTFTAVFITGGALAFCLFLREFEHTDSFAPMIFILAVFLVARFTDGFFYGVAASVAGVLAVNYVFTYPYFKFNFSLAGYPLTIVCMLAVSLVTSALTTQTKLQETLRMEMEREKTRSQLLSSVSHDLRTPLTVILGANSAVIEGYDMLTPKEAKALLGEVNNEAQWLIRVVENLLTVTRMDTNRAGLLRKQPEVAEEPLSEAVTRFHTRFPDYSVTVKVPDEVLIVPMDATLIEQVLINLLENAVMHAKGSNRAELRVRREEGFAVFEVTDNGSGIARQKLPHLFDGSLATDRAHRSGESRNMGIGLSVCAGIVAAHGGKMSAENVKGGGARFRFTLPLGDTGGKTA